VRALRWAPALLAVAPLWAQSRDDAPSPSADSITLTHFAVERGDATLITTPGGRHILIDAGSADSRIAEQLQASGVDTLDLLIATTDDRDHSGGIADVRQRLVVRRHLAQRSQTLDVDGVTLTILPPALNDAVDAPNERGVMLEYGEFSALFAGDSRNAQLSEWIAADLVKQVDLVTAPDHGSTSGVNWRWMTTTQPSLVVISPGNSKVYAYPSWLTVELWKMLQARVMRTDRDGTIRVSALPDGSFSTATSSDSARE
jgi:competence protein ComEC